LSSDVYASLSVFELQTKFQLETYARRVREGKDLMAALDFCRFLSRAGLANLLTESGLEGARMRERIETLQTDIQERFQKNEIGGRLEGQDVLTIDHKLDLIAGQLSRLVASPSLAVRELPAPELRVIEGGKSGT